MAMAAGAALNIAGSAIGGFAADDRRERFEEFWRNLEKPDVGKSQGDWFADLEKFFPKATQLSQQLREDELTQNLALRERALPGSTKALQDAMGSIAPLLRGELPDSVMASFQRAGGASTVGLGFGGSQFGALNTGLFGARGSLGAMQTGMGLLPSLLSSMPSVSAPTTMGLLGQLMTPQQRINLQMQLRQQEIGMENTLESMPTMMDTWAANLRQSGSALMGMGGAGSSGSAWMGGGGGGGGMGGGSQAFSSNPWGSATGANYQGAVNQAAGRLY